MTLRTTPEDQAALERLAAAYGLSLQQAALRAIREAAERLPHAQAVQDASELVIGRRARLLDRLSRT